MNKIFQRKVTITTYFQRIIVVTLSYFLLQNLCPTELKRKRGRNCYDMPVTSPDTLEMRACYLRTGSKQMAILVYVRV